MPLCHVDIHRSPTFTSLVESLKKRFPHVEDDLAEIWPKIAQDYRNACKGESIPTFNDTVFKYRSKNSDMRKGSGGGYRIIGYYHAENNTLYPIFAYSKADMADVDSRTIAKLVSEFLGQLKRNSK